MKIIVQILFIPFLKIQVLFGGYDVMADTIKVKWCLDGMI